MTSSKWQKFNSGYSPVQVHSNIDGIEKKEHTLMVDWNRLLKEDVTINGQPLLEAASKYIEKTDQGNQFKDQAALLAFFREVLLSNLDQSKKQTAIPTLTKFFHQRGLMYPVSSPLDDYILESGFSLAGNSTDAFKRRVNISSTDLGFRVQEFYTTNKLWDIAEGDEPKPIMPKEGKFLIDATATIHLDLSQDPANPTLTIESNHISYDHPEIKKAFDKRHWGHKIVDFFSRLFGRNKVIDLSQNPPQRPEEKKQTGYQIAEQIRDRPTLASDGFYNQLCKLNKVLRQDTVNTLLDLEQDQLDSVIKDLSGLCFDQKKERFIRGTDKDILGDLLLAYVKKHDGENFANAYTPADTLGTPPAAYKPSEAVKGLFERIYAIAAQKEKEHGVNQGEYTGKLGQNLFNKIYNNMMQDKVSQLSSERQMHSALANQQWIDKKDANGNDNPSLFFQRFLPEQPVVEVRTAPHT